MSQSETKVAVDGWVCVCVDANVKARALRWSKVLNVTEKLWRMET